MPQPTPGDVHVNKPLTNISIAFMQEEKSFVSPQVGAIVPVQKQGDIFFKYPREYFYRLQMKKRAPGAETARGGYGITQDTYYCDVWGLHLPVDDQTRANTDAPLDADRDATEYLSLQAMLNMENQWISTLFQTSTWTGSSTGADITPSTLWDASGGNPILDMKTEFRAMKKKTGYKPNCVVFGSKAWAEGVENNDLVLDRIKHTQRGIVTEDIVAALLGVEKVIVCESTQNTAAEGATASYSFFATEEDVACYYVEPRASIRKPSAFYGFGWQGLFGAGSMGQRIKRFRVDTESADRVEIEQAFTWKLVAADLGIYFDGVVS